MAAREDAGSDYNDEGTGRPGSLKFTKRRKSSGGADGDGIGGSVVPKKRRKRREKEREREPSVEADKLPELTPEERELSGGTRVRLVLMAPSLQVGDLNLVRRSILLSSRASLARGKSVKRKATKRSVFLMACRIALVTLVI